MASPGPKSPEQTEKSRKYDRQIRLWGDHGQSSLENANVCLIHATGLGTEILKSLVLPGIGTFTIVDGKKVCSDDLETNFFLDFDKIGDSRAVVATNMLCELNPDIHGDYLEDDVDHILDSNPTFFNSFTVVISTDLKEGTLIRLASTLWSNDIPLIHCRSYGFLGYIRIQLREHTIVESHPDNQAPDLRLDRPFPSLLEHCNEINMDEMPLKDHAHIPYLVILYKCLQEWRQRTGEDLPKNWREKDALREIIRSKILVNDDGVPEDEENFEEAIRAVNSSIAPSTVPSHVRTILDDGACVNVTSKSKPFWVLAKAVRDFVDNEGAGALPLRGSLPDMTAETSRYVALQQLYHAQALRDSDTVYRRAQQLLHELNQPAETITEADARLFCRHSHDIHVVRGSSIADEYQGKNQSLQNLESDPPGSLVLLYLLFRGVDRFQEEYSCFPGELKDQVEPDITRLKGCISRLLSEWGCGPFSRDDYVHEMCRYGGCELHSVSAFVGGCAAQEAIKLITKQYKPVHNTFIYDAMTATTLTFTL